MTAVPVISWARPETPHAPGEGCPSPHLYDGCVCTPPQQLQGCTIDTCSCRLHGCICCSGARRLAGLLRRRGPSQPQLHWPLRRPAVGQRLGHAEGADGWQIAQHVAQLGLQAARQWQSLGRGGADLVARLVARCAASDLARVCAGAVRAGKVKASMPGQGKASAGHCNAYAGAGTPVWAVVPGALLGQTQAAPPGTVVTQAPKRCSKPALPAAPGAAAFRCGAVRLARRWDVHGMDDGRQGAVPLD